MNWYTITTFRQLADNAALSVKKGERVFLTGRLRIREWESGERSGTTVEIEAESLGHDLSWGTSSFTRVLAGTAIDSSDAGSESGSTVGGAAGMATDSSASDGETGTERASQRSAPEALAPVGAWSAEPPF